MAAPNNFHDNDYYEHDPRWTAVDAYTFSHLHPSSQPNHDALAHALATSRAAGLPDISTYPNLGKYIALQCKTSRASTALEVGTLGGYTAIWLASANPGLRLTTVEVDPHHAAVARDNIAHAGLSERIEVILGPGTEVLPRLAEEVRQGKRSRFGFAFIDADKENNWAYFDAFLGMAEAGASVVVDNVVRMGKIVDPSKVDDDGEAGARRLIEEVGRDPRVEGVVIQTVGEKNYDGFLLAVIS
ncbi:MAG: hypothetical protein M1821_006370 [Bathelium mastoideum]|nr:MAG: hypothetical protein M1821_006370 [Bathelium mastoideum]KAI9693648.1 MAG: hypothetical protein M1822_002919 [Bathelium mastoideum]